MNNKAEVDMKPIGLMITVFVALIVGMVIFQESGKVLSTVTQTNAFDGTATLPANAGVLVLQGQSVSSVVIINATGGETINSGNYTITNNDVSTGTLRAILTMGNTKYVSKPVNITYNFEPVGYVNDSGTRAIFGVILVMAALAIAVVSMSPVMRNKVLDYVR